MRQKCLVSVPEGFFIFKGRLIKKNMKKNPDFIIIPHQVILDDELQPLDRILYGVIYWLVQLKGEKCIASNSTLKELCGAKNKITIANSLSRLERRGYIFRVFSKDKKQREEIIPLISFRRGIHQMMNGGSSNDEGGDSSNDEQNNKSIKEEKINNILLATEKVAGEKDGLSDKDRKELISLFKEVNPNYEVLFSRKNQTDALKRLYKKFGFEKLKSIITALPYIINRPYAPRITTPIQLENKLGELKIFYEQEKQKIDKSKSKVGIITKNNNEVL